MKKLISEAFMEKMKERWKLSNEDPYYIKATKFDKNLNEIPDEYKVYHPLIGYCRMKEVREAVALRAIVFSNNSWRIPTEQYMDFGIEKAGKLSWKATAEHCNWRDRFKSK